MINFGCCLTNAPFHIDVEQAKAFLSSIFTASAIAVFQDCCYLGGEKYAVMASRRRSSLSLAQLAIALAAEAIEVLNAREAAKPFIVSARSTQDKDLAPSQLYHHVSLTSLSNTASTSSAPATSTCSLTETHESRFSSAPNLFTTLPVESFESFTFITPIKNMSSTTIPLQKQVENLRIRQTKIDRHVKKVTKLHCPTRYDLLPVLTPTSTSTPTSNSSSNKSELILFNPLEKCMPGSSEIRHLIHGTRLSSLSEFQLEGINPRSNANELFPNSAFFVTNSFEQAIAHVLAIKYLTVIKKSYDPVILLVFAVEVDVLLGLKDYIFTDEDGKIRKGTFQTKVYDGRIGTQVSEFKSLASKYLKATRLDITWSELDIIISPTCIPNEGKGGEIRISGSDNIEVAPIQVGMTRTKRSDDVLRYFQKCLVRVSESSFLS